MQSDFIFDRDALLVHRGQQYIGKERGLEQATTSGRGAADQLPVIFSMSDPVRSF